MTLPINQSETCKKLLNSSKLMENGEYATNNKKENKVLGKILSHSNFKLILSPNKMLI